MTAVLTCRELITFLGDYVAGELPAEQMAAFERHLAICASCVAYLASYRETIRLAREAASAPELRIEDVPEDLVKAILESRS